MKKMHTGELLPAPHSTSPYQVHHSSNVSYYNCELASHQGETSGHLNTLWRLHVLGIRWSQSRMSSGATLTDKEIQPLTLHSVSGFSVISVPGQWEGT